MARKCLRSMLVVVLVFSMTVMAFGVQSIDGVSGENAQYVQKSDNLPDPLTEKQLEMREKALQAKLNGKAFGATHEVTKGLFVELEREGEGAVWTVLGEFADLEHNMMPEPDREFDNSTIWEPDFSREYYMDLLFDDAKGANSMRNYYIEQSSGRYAVYGDVTDWVMVPQNAEYYDDNPDSNVWYFLEDSVKGWYDAQIDAGMTNEDINAYLSQFDVWDRYDYNGNGNFDEPDGYIDTFQSVHAGAGEEGGGAPWTIWSHSWYARYHLIGHDGPDFNLSGGIQIGNSDYWIGKYTIQPENGGVGVFTHEYGHDLGLPDLYDYYGENGTGFWTLMSSGSWLNDGLNDIGSKPSHMGAWEKFQLGWLNYDVARAGQKSTHRLGPMEFNTKFTQGLFVILPQKDVTTVIGTPYAGDFSYYSGSGNNLDNFMTKLLHIPDAATLSAKVQYEIELDWDYAYVVVSSDNGVTWIPLQTNLSTDTNPNGQNFGKGITGYSGGWTDLTVDLSDYAGQDLLIGFRYWTDGAAVETGLMIDEIAITGFDTDGAETDAGWTMDGFRVTTGTESKFYSHYYVAEYRTYLGYDAVLKVGPYYFGYANDPSKADYVDHFAYQDGLLINYWDTSQTDNNTGLHPGAGLLLPIDAHFETLYRWDGIRWRNRIQTYDSTFTIAPTDGIPNIHHLSVLDPVESLPGVKAFDDRILHYDPSNPLGSVMHPNTGTIIEVKQVNASATPFMQVIVRPVK